MTKRVDGHTLARGASWWAVAALIAAHAACATGTPPPDPGGAGGAAGSGGSSSSTGGGHSGACDTAPEGTVVMKNTPPDCRALVCDAMGNAVMGIDPTNVPISSDPCLAGTCDMAGNPGTTPVDAGTPCASAEGGQRCDGAGNCVECITDADCPPGKTCNVLNACAGSPCMDGVLDGAETDVDCGGGVCLPCGPNKACKVGSDCETGACDPIMHTCLGPMCMNQQKDGNETDIDCGGACGGCAVGKACLADQDCASQACDALSLTCVADQCDNHQKEGQETDVDCGGISCAPCAAGKTCVSDFDCISGSCDPSQKCAAEPCTDGVKSGDESDVDCGGSCSACALGKVCNTNVDCTSNACDALSLVCITDQCTDHHRDGTETDVDCGGPNTCARCGVGKKCLVSSDCVAGAMCPPSAPKVCY